MNLTIDSSVRAKHYNANVRQNGAIKYIVVHYTANGGSTATALSNARYFQRGERVASANFIVDQFPVVYESVSPQFASYHSGGTKYATGGSMYGKITNNNSIGIEMVSQSIGNKYFIPEKTIQHTVELIVSLLEEFNLDVDDVFRHYDVTGKPCPLPLIDEKEWQKFKDLIRGEMEVRYNKVSEMPTYARPTIQKLLDKGIVKGDASGNLDLSLDMIRMLIFNDRAGLYK